MLELLKKTMLTGIGLAAVSREKLEELTKELIEKGNLTEQEGKKFVQEMSSYAEKTRDEMEKQVDNYVKKALDRMDLVRKKDLDEIKEAIAELQSRLEKEQS